MNRNLAYQEEPWQEVISGKVVMMSPRPAINHIRISGNLFQIFSTYLKGRRCEPFPDGTDLYLSEKNHFIPDFMIVCDPNKVKANAVYGAPDFVVEVLSLGSLKRDRFHKMAAYEKAGVQEYWIVNPDSRSIEQYWLEDGKFVLHNAYGIYSDGMLEKMTEEERAEIVTEFKCRLYDDLVIQVADIFQRVV